MVKTKEHIKTPYKTTKSRSSRNKSKSSKDNNIINFNKSNISTKSSNYWKTLLDNNDYTFMSNFSQEQDVDVNRNCNSVILDNPFNNQKEYKNLFGDEQFDVLGIDSGIDALLVARFVLEDTAASHAAYYVVSTLLRLGQVADFVCQLVEQTTGSDVSGLVVEVVGELRTAAMNAVGHATIAD